MENINEFTSKEDIETFDLFTHVMHTINDSDLEQLKLSLLSEILELKKYNDIKISIINNELLSRKHFSDSHKMNRSSIDICHERNNSNESNESNESCLSNCFTFCALDLENCDSCTSD